MSKHTPGPWIWKPANGDELPALVGAGESLVCSFGIERSYYPESGCEPETEDMLLIAASPDLLEALEVMVGKARKQNWNDNYPIELQKAVDAISKAKGDQP